MDFNTTDIALASIGVVVTSVGLLGWVVKFLLQEMKKSMDNNTESYKLVAKALDKLSRTTDKNTMATKSADSYLRQRNGRDNEHHTAVLKAIETIPNTLRKIADDQSKAIIKAVTVKEQIVEHQQVDHMHIKPETDNG